MQQMRETDDTRFENQRQNYNRLNQMKQRKLETREREYQEKEQRALERKQELEQDRDMKMQ